MLVKKSLNGGEKDVEILKKIFQCSLKKDLNFTLDYISIACNKSLNELKTIKSDVLISAAVYFKNVRLIDNFLY